MSAHSTLARVLRVPIPRHIVVVTRLEFHDTKIMDEWFMIQHRSPFEEIS